MASRYGYVRGERRIVRMPVKSGEVIATGDMLKLTSGYVESISAGNAAIGVACGEILTAGTASGSYWIDVDTSEQSQYRFPVTSGTLDVTHRMKTCDTNGAQALALTSSVDNILILDVDIPNQEAICALILQPAGV